MGGGNLVEFGEAFDTANFEETIRVCTVNRVDTDSDGFREWLVFYQTDPIQQRNWRQPCPDSSPWLGAIYDNDRGEPPIIFPYELTPPNRESLGDSGVSSTLIEVVQNRSDTTGVNIDSSATTGPIPEILIYGWLRGVPNQLTIFTFQQNTRPWDTPTNTPPRYQVIGAFMGDGGVAYNQETKLVTVLDTSPLGRSQLAVRSVYQLHGPVGDQTYMSLTDPTKLAAPIESTIDFAFGPPEDIYKTEYPEQIVLAFYQSLDQDMENVVDWDSREFLAPVGTTPPSGDALQNFDANNFAYFFFTELDKNIQLSDIYDLSIVQLQYFPKVETTPSERTIEGENPVKGRVDIQIVGGDQTKIPDHLLSFEMVFLNGEWKINRRLK